MASADCSGDVLGIMYDAHVQDCEDLCLVTTSCRMLDFNFYDLVCRIYDCNSTVVSLEHTVKFKIFQDITNQTAGNRATPTNITFYLKKNK